MWTSYCIDGGRLAYFGPIGCAFSYFSAIGLPCPHDFNPADFYLEMVYKPPSVDTADTWRDIYFSTDLGKKMQDRLVEVIQKSDNNDTPTLIPTDFERFINCFWFFVKYNTVCPGYYIYRTVYLVLCAIFIGTLFLNSVDSIVRFDLLQHLVSAVCCCWINRSSCVGSTTVV